MTTVYIRKIVFTLYIAHPLHIFRSTLNPRQTLKTKRRRRTCVPARCFPGREGNLGKFEDDFFVVVFGLQKGIRKFGNFQFLGKFDQDEQYQKKIRFTWSHDIEVERILEINPQKFRLIFQMKHAQSRFFRYDSNLQL